MKKLLEKVSVYRKYVYSRDLYKYELIAVHPYRT